MLFGVMQYAAIIMNRCPGEVIASLTFGDLFSFDSKSFVYYSSWYQCMQGCLRVELITVMKVYALAEEMTM